MRRVIDRRSVLAVVAVAWLSLGCAGIPVQAASPYPNPSRVAQGAILGGMAGTAIGPGVGYRDRGRGALIGGLGGVILGAIFADQIEQHEAWHHAHDAPYDDAGEHAWDDEPGYEHDPEPRWEEPAWEPEPVDPRPDPAFAEVLFDPGSATLTRGAEARLRYLAQQVRERDDVEVLLRGHSDGRETGGFDLSEARARAVRDFLAEEGVAVRRIAWVGFGGAQPVASNDTGEGRQRNRRVEVVLREPEPDPFS